MSSETTRRENARERVLARLREGPASNIELNAICYRYGARIMELRQAGAVVSLKPIGDGVFVYTLERDIGSEPRVRTESIPLIVVPVGDGRLF